jgi:hypothetical protein
MIALDFSLLPFAAQYQHTDFSLGLSLGLCQNITGDYIFLNTSMSRYSHCTDMTIPTSIPRNALRVARWKHHWVGASSVDGVTCGCTTRTRKVSLVGRGDAICETSVVRMRLLRVIRGPRMESVVRVKGLDGGLSRNEDENCDRVS